MRANEKPIAAGASRRAGPRVHSLREITIRYEGRDEQIVVKPPDISARGMFVSTPRKFPEGTVLHLRFRLELTGKEIQTRCEVRYCLAGVGVGVEFVGISPEAVDLIEREISLSMGRASKPSRGRLTRPTSRRRLSRRK